MKFVTSINPNNISKAKQCIDTWRNFCTEIVTVQGPDENIDIPDITVVHTDNVGKEFDTKCPRIYELLKQAPCIIINSDIEIVTSREIFEAKFYQNRSKTLECAIRYDYTESNTTLNKYGIDLFKITPEILDILEDTEFTIGQPGWDYYLVMECNNNGFYINAHKKPKIVTHQVHGVNWHRWKLTYAQSLLERRYNTDSSSVTKKIQRLTGRR